MYMKVLDNPIDKLLGEIGLNDSERQVYLAGNGQARTSSELIKLTDMPRPTVMAALRELQNYGLCQTRRRDGRSLVYTMQPLAALKQHLGQKVRQLDELMERLDAVPVKSDTLTVIEKDGQPGLQDLLEQALRCKSRQWQIIAPRDNALAHLPADYIRYFKRIRKDRQIQSETLWSADWQNAQLNLHDLLMRKPRFVPVNLSKQIPSLLLAFDDKLLIVEGASQPSSVLINSAAVVKTFQLIFEMAWRSALVKTPGQTF